MISGPAVYFTGSHVTPAQVRLFVDQTRTKLRARTLLLEQMDADIDKVAIAMIELKIGHSKVLLEELARECTRRKQWLESARLSAKIDVEGGLRRHGKVVKGVHCRPGGEEHQAPYSGKGRIHGTEELQTCIHSHQQYQNKNTLERFLFLCEGLIIR